MRTSLQIYETIYCNLHAFDCSHLIDFNRIPVIASNCGYSLAICVQTSLKWPFFDLLLLSPWQPVPLGHLEVSHNTSKYPWGKIISPIWISRMSDKTIKTKLLINYDGLSFGMFKGFFNCIFCHLSNGIIILNSENDLNAYICYSVVYSIT